MTRKNRLYRVLALILCLCLTAPYLPVPGHAEGCGHVHGEGCYQEVTQCVHAHGEDCWSDPEAKDAGEEPDACAHVCGEDTGCVTKELNCPHVHDDTCGEQLQEEPEPEPEEPEPEEPPKEEPQEPKNEEPKQEEENRSLVISRWEWVDEEKILDPETGVLCLSSEEPILFEQVAELLPKAILATVGEEAQTIPLDHWDPQDYPQETGANSGSYLIEATLPEGYTLAEDAAPLTLHLEFAQAQALVECGHENVNMDTGMCKDCTAQVYEAKIGDKGYATLKEALEDAQTEENEGCTVTVLCNVSEGTGYYIRGGFFTLDLNEKILYGGVDLSGGELTIRNGNIASAFQCFCVNGGTLKIESGHYGGNGTAYAIYYVEGTVLISGGEFSGSVKTFFTIQNKPISDFLADGKAFYSTPSIAEESIVDASGSEVRGKVYVLDHVDKYEPVGDGTYKCACGRVCDHTKANMETGTCLCGQKQLYEAKIGDTGYATLGEAMDAAQEDGNKGCTVVMLCDCDYQRDFIITKGVFTLDLNEKRLSMLGSIRVDGGELTVRNGEIHGFKYFALHENGGTLKIESGYFTSEDPLRGGLGLISTIGMTDISGGRFDKIAIYSGLSAEIIGYVVDILADGKAIYSKPEGGEENLVDASKTQVSGDLYVLPHTDTYDAKTGKCPCGRCKHNIDMTTGRCSSCQSQVYLAKIGDTGYAKMDAALTAAQRDANKGCTLTMLCNVYSERASYAISGGDFTLDLNGKTVSGVATNPIIEISGGVLKVVNDGCVINKFDSMVKTSPVIKLNAGKLSIAANLTSEANVAIEAAGGILEITGGEFVSSRGPFSLQAASTANVCISGGSFSAGIKSDGQTVIDLIADGYAVYDGDTIVDASVDAISRDISVKEHPTHTYNATTGKCPCGRTCKHTDVDMTTGKCAACQKQLYVAKIGDTGYATLQAALLDAEKAEKKGCTVTMLCDVEIRSPVSDGNGQFVFDLNGRNLTITGWGWQIIGDITIVTSVAGGKVTESTYATLAVLMVDSGKLTIKSGEFVSNTERLTWGTTILSGGVFTGSSSIRISATPAAELLEDGYAFYSDAEGSNIVDASGDTLSGTVYVLPNHPTHTYDPTTGKCPCGRTCAHTNVDMTTGKCAACQKQLYVAKIGNTGYATLEEALTDAQQHTDRNTDCTVTMLCDYIGNNAIEIFSGIFTLDLNKKILKIVKGIQLKGGELTLRNGQVVADESAVYVKNGTLKIESGSYNSGMACGLLKEGGTVIISGGEFFSIKNAIKITTNESVVELITDGKAIFKYGAHIDDCLVDASGTALPSDGCIYHVEDHPTHTYNATTGKCPCGRTIPQATLDTAPAAANLTYNGQAQNLVEPGVATGGKLMYSLAENGTYTETVPTGKKADTYTVWYYVLGTPGKYYNTEKQSLTVTVGKKDLTPVVTIQDQDFDGTKEVKHFTVALEGKEDGDDLTYTLGTLEFDATIPGTRTASLTGTPELKGKDAGNYNLKAPTGLTGKIKATARYLDVTDSLPNADTVTIDGEEYQVKVESGKCYVILPDTGNLLTVYTYQTNADNKTYPDTMRVFAIDRQDTGSTLAEIPEFENLLTYEGCSIRLNGTKGIRMITSIDQAKKKALVNSDLAGYTLVEYGTVITREGTLGGKTLNLGTGKSNYAYSRANKKDPVFKTENGRIQYTNVLVNFQPADYKTDLVLRPYIKLRDASGNEVVLYGGTVTRSIYYIAQQNINDYKPGSAGYKYLQEILGQK